MPTGYPSLTKNQKQEIITRIKDKGEKVSDLAKEYGVWSKTIYNLLKTQINPVKKRKKIKFSRCHGEKIDIKSFLGRLPLSSLCNTSWLV